MIDGLRGSERKQKAVDKWKRIEDELGALRQQHLYREIKVIESSQRSHVRYRGRDMLMLASNSYLDFCDEERIKEAAAQALAEYGTGSGGSRLTTGTTILHTQLEEALARFKGREAAVVFNTGFAANGGILPALGFAITLTVIGKKNLIPFFIAGFFAVIYLGLDTMAVAIFATCTALLLNLFRLKEEEA